MQVVQLATTGFSLFRTPTSLLWCFWLQTKAWREQNSVRSKELYAKSYDKNKETILEKSRANQHLNNEYSKVYRQKNNKLLDEFVTPDS